MTTLLAAVLLAYAPAPMPTPLPARATEAQRNDYAARYAVAYLDRVCLQHHAGLVVRVESFAERRDTAHPFTVHCERGTLVTDWRRL